MFVKIYFYTLTSEQIKFLQPIDYYSENYLDILFFYKNNIPIHNYLYEKQIFVDTIQKPIKTIFTKPINLSDLNIDLVKNFLNDNYFVLDKFYNITSSYNFDISWVLIKAREMQTFIHKESEEDLLLRSKYKKIFGTTVYQLFIESQIKFPDNKDIEKFFLIISSKILERVDYNYLDIILYQKFKINSSFKFLLTLNLNDLLYEKFYLWFLAKSLIFKYINFSSKGVSDPHKIKRTTKIVLLLFWNVDYNDLFSLNEKQLLANIIVTKLNFKQLFTLVKENLGIILPNNIVNLSNIILDKELLKQKILFFENLNTEQKTIIKRLNNFINKKYIFNEDIPSYSEQIFDELENININYNNFDIILQKINQLFENIRLIDNNLIYRFKILKSVKQNLDIFLIFVC